MNHITKLNILIMFIYKNISIKQVLAGFNNPYTTQPPIIKNYRGLNLINITF